MSDAWNPEQYHLFAKERRQPFEDLKSVVKPVPGGRVVDLGCGSGELTADLHKALEAKHTLGIDSSKTMLGRAKSHEGKGVTFREGDIADFAWAGESPFDVVFSNSALQWVSEPDHHKLVARLTEALAPGGQLAFQVPANYDHPSHILANQVAMNEPYHSALVKGGWTRQKRPVLTPEAYAELLDELGYAEQHVHMQIYGHRLDSSSDVVEWTRGTNLTQFEAVLSEKLYEGFVKEYREELLRRLGDKSPYFYAFKRILVWGRRPK